MLGDENYKMKFANILWKILIFSAWLSVGFSLSQNDQKYSKCNIGQHLNQTDRNGRVKLLVCTEKINGVPLWKFVDASPTLGEIFNPAKDCADIVDRLPEADDGFYWIILTKGTKHKIWCDVHTDGGGFALVGTKDSPVSWTVPSNASPVHPQGPPHWSSDLGDYNVLDFRVQFSIDKSFKETKADWFYRLNLPRELGSLFSLKNECSYVQAGIGNIEFVKDLLTQSINKNFKCSNFGPLTHHMLGWGIMNYCLRNQCNNGYAILDAIKLRYDDFGGYSFSAVSSFSGMNHNATAFVGCNHGKCCACFGPKGGTENYCGSNCTTINGGTVITKAFVWFWVRNRVPKRVWKKCMEFVVRNSTGKPEKQFIDPQTGIAHKGSCKRAVKSFLNDGTLTTSDKESFEKIPNVPGLILYRADNEQLYVNQGSKWQALTSELEIVQLKQKVQNQENKTNIQETKIQSLESIITKLQKQNQDIMKRINRLDPPASCSALLTKHPSTASGMYYINPKRVSSSQLVQVYCDMTSKIGVGVTVIGHNSLSRTLVKGFNPPGSYQRKIEYDIPIQQIVAIINQSKNCEQFIKYECYDSIIFSRSTGIPYAWWVSRQGSKMNYWGGAAVNSGKCACGMTNSCAISGSKCNCDRNDAKWREDSGYLTDKNTLPVTELRFGDTSNPKVEERGYHTLGKLRCWN